MNFVIESGCRPEGSGGAMILSIGMGNLMGEEVCKDRCATARRGAVDMGFIVLESSAKDWM